MMRNLVFYEQFIIFAPENQIDAIINLNTLNYGLSRSNKNGLWYPSRKFV